MNQENEEISFVFSNEKRLWSPIITIFSIYFCVLLLFVFFMVHDFSSSLIEIVKGILIFSFFASLVFGPILYLMNKLENRNPKQYIVTNEEFIITEIPQENSKSNKVPKDFIRYRDIIKLQYKNTTFTKEIRIDYIANNQEFPKFIGAGSYFDHPSPEKWEQLFLELTRRLPPHVKVIAK